MRDGRKGMTLIEIMVAITILAIVSTVIFGGFSTTMRNKTRLEEMADRSHVIRVAMERMVAELAQAYVSIQVNPNPALQTMNTCFIGGRSGRGHRIDFTSFSHRRLYRDALGRDLWAPAPGEPAWPRLHGPAGPPRPALVPAAPPARAAAAAGWV